MRRGADPRTNKTAAARASDDALTPVIVLTGSILLRIRLSQDLRRAFRRNKAAGDQMLPIR